MTQLLPAPAGIPGAEGAVPLPRTLANRDRERLPATASSWTTSRAAAARPRAAGASGC